MLSGLNERSRRWWLRAGCSLLACTAACAIDSRDLDSGELDEPGCADDEACAGSGGAGGASQTGGPSNPGAAGAGTPGRDDQAAGGSSALDAAGAAMNQVESEASGSAGSAGSSAGEAGGASNAGAGELGGASGAASGAGESSGCPTNLLVNGGFEAGEAPWVSFSTGQDPLIYDFTVETYDGSDPHAGLWLGWLGGVPSEVNRLSQTLSVPANVTALALQYSLRIQVFEPHPNVDFLRVRLVVAGQPRQIAEFTNADAGEDWINLTPPALPVATDGRALSVVLEFESEIGAGPGTNFFLDDLALVPTCMP